MVPQSVKDEVYKKFASAKVKLKPFPHYYVKGLFPRQYYKQLLANLPDSEKYERYEPPYESRLALTLTEKTCTMLHPQIRDFWQSFSSWLNSEEFAEKIMVTFGAMLKMNYEYRTDQLKKYSDENGRINVTPLTVLVRDAKHYSIGPHTDSAAKFLTMLFYMPKSRKLKNFGTSIYKPKAKNFTEWPSIHNPHEKFKRIRTFPFLPNSAFVFIKTDNSFHGVEKKAYADVTRDTIMYMPQIGHPKDDAPNITLDVNIFKKSA